MAKRSESITPRKRVGVGAAIIVVLVAIAGTVLVGIARGSAPPDEVVSPAGASVDTSNAPFAASVYVHVSGAVAAPGLYQLSSDARVMDAIAAAGGFSDDADSASINLARPVSDGEQLHVAIPGEQPASGSGSAGSGAVDGSALVNVNTADVAILDTLPGVGPAIAQRIVDWRTENGRFNSVDDLLAVPGIGDSILAGLRDLVSV
ncbi:competence protein ComEA [Microbacterium endophyticum]|uniref:Competence protein ComEA n=1 Tax=Microbacterium endophyticum TaxID=1526412 RepID=A0A7W4YKW4_9MICO|nr:ComEA family DNA-binding protein [Microbacterium endophyticum]MBB2974528.1 competence protein ComEA [Microbacterium endophyticum]NIK36825.1 competence protein ComEA [Microbacterium endophyticum]